MMPVPWQPRCRAEPPPDWEVQHQVGVVGSACVQCGHPWSGHAAGSACLWCVQAAIATVTVLYGQQLASLVAEVSGQPDPLAGATLGEAMIAASRPPEERR